MNVSNLYFTTRDFKMYQATESLDAKDDLVIDSIMEQTARFIDEYTGRRFYPRIETQLYNAPLNKWVDKNTIYFRDDLLALTTLTNGDATTIASNNYYLDSVNNPPYWMLKLKSSSNIMWQPDANGDYEQTISVSGVWGYHNNYAGAWVLGGTLAAAMPDTTALTATMTAGHTLFSQQIWKIGSEIVQGTVSANTLTFNVRGDNGSTAAAHLISVNVYYWRPIAAVLAATEIIATSLYKERFGENVSGMATVTAAGVVLSPAGIPDKALRFLQPFVRIS